MFEHKRSNDFYRAQRKAVLKKFWQVFRSKKMEDNKRVKVLLKVIQRISDKTQENSRGDRHVDHRSMR